MPDKASVWAIPDDEAHQLVQDLIGLGVPKSVIARAERVREWGKETRETMAFLHTITHYGRFSQTALKESARQLEVARWRRPMLERTRQE